MKQCLSAVVHWLHDSDSKIKACEIKQRRGKTDHLVQHEFVTF